MKIWHSKPLLKIGEISNIFWWWRDFHNPYCRSRPRPKFLWQKFWTIYSGNKYFLKPVKKMFRLWGASGEPPAIQSSSDIFCQNFKTNFVDHFDLPGSGSEKQLTIRVSCPGWKGTVGQGLQVAGTRAGPALSGLSWCPTTMWTPVSRTRSMNQVRYSSSFPIHSAWLVLLLLLLSHSFSLVSFSWSFLVYHRRQFWNVTN
jgi:hypothetical protein